MQAIIIFNGSIINPHYADHQQGCNILFKSILNVISPLSAKLAENIQSKVKMKTFDNNAQYHNIHIFYITLPGVKLHMSVLRDCSHFMMVLF